MAEFTSHDIREMLTIMGWGHQVGPDFDMSGAQNSTWMQKVIRAGVPEAEFRRAQKMAAVGHPTTPQQTYDFLRATGLTDAQVDDTFKQAGIDIRNTRVDWSHKMGALSDVIGRSWGDSVKNYIVNPRPEGGGAAPMAPSTVPIGPTSMAEGESQEMRKAAPRPDVPVQQAQKVRQTTGMNIMPGSTSIAPAANAIQAPPALRKGASEAEIVAHVRQHYGYMSWGLDIPEIRKIVLDIAENPNTKWTPEAVDGAISATPWWQANGVKVQTWLQRRSQDPATTQKEIKDQFDAFKSAAQAGGIEIPDERLWDMAEESLKWGWSEAMTQSVIGSEYKFDPSKPTAVTTDVKKKAHDFLVVMSDETVGWWTKQLLTGNKTDEDLQLHLTAQAKSMFPHLSGPLDRGEPLSVYLDQHQQTAAKLLEVDPDTIDFTQPKWQKLLTQVDPKTGERSMMDIGTMSSVIKKDKAYGYEYTKQAHNDAAGLGSALLSKMGVTT